MQNRGQVWVDRDCVEWARSSCPQAGHTFCVYWDNLLGPILETLQMCSLRPCEPHNARCLDGSFTVCKLHPHAFFISNALLSSFNRLKNWSLPAVCLWVYYLTSLNLHFPSSKWRKQHTPFQVLRSILCILSGGSRHSSMLISLCPRVVTRKW